MEGQVEDGRMEGVKLFFLTDKYVVGDVCCPGKLQ